MKCPCNGFLTFLFPSLKICTIWSRGGVPLWIPKLSRISGNQKEDCQVRGVLGFETQKNSGCLCSHSNFVMCCRALFARIIDVVHSLAWTEINDECDKPKRLSVRVTKTKLSFQRIRACPAALGWICVSIVHPNHVWEISCFFQFSLHFPCILVSSYSLNFLLDLQLTVIWLWSDDEWWYYDLFKFRHSILVTIKRSCDSVLV